jgi:hypothetical protein
VANEYPVSRETIHGACAEARVITISDTSGDEPSTALVVTSLMNHDG